MSRLKNVGSHHSNVGSFTSLQLPMSFGLSQIAYESYDMILCGYVPIPKEYESSVHYLNILELCSLNFLCICYMKLRALYLRLTQALDPIDSEFQYQASVVLGKIVYYQATISFSIDARYIISLINIISYTCIPFRSPTHKSKHSALKA